MELNYTKLSNRKSDHIALTLESQSSIVDIDQRFNYEPLFKAHPTLEDNWKVSFLGHTLNFPWWFSSMTGGTKMAKTINTNMALAACEFKLGMGLGSCRPLLENRQSFDDFNMRPHLGKDQPLFANIGVAQIEESIKQNEVQKIHDLVLSLEANGLIIHLNTLQEFFQPEGDRFHKAPLETLEHFLKNIPYKVIVKEVGHGFGPKSLRYLMELPIHAIEFGAFGGTNFSKIEQFRAIQKKSDDLIHVGHSAQEMVSFVNNILDKNPNLPVKQFIISGGIRSVLDGYYLLKKINTIAVFGQAQAILREAQGSYEHFRAFILSQLETLMMAKNYLELKNEMEK